MARLAGGTALTGFVAGLIGGMVAPKVLPELSRLARPGAKGVMRFGATFYERARETAARLSETAGDLAAEVKAEREAAERLASETASSDETAEAVVTPIDNVRSPSPSKADV